MNLAPVDSITVPESRIRKQFDEDRLEELATNILDVGLIHLPVLRDGHTLVSGERRLRAIKIIYARGETFTYMGAPVPPGQVPFAAFESLSDFEARKVELYENVKRVDLPWQVAVQQTAEIHKLESEANSEWTERDTANQIKRKDRTSDAEASVRDRLVVAEYLDHPEVRQAKSEAEATQRVKKILQRDLEEAARKRQKKKGTRHTLLHGTAEAHMSEQDPNHFDVILTDPPYGIGAENFGFNVSGAFEKHKYSDDEFTALACYETLAILGYSVAKEQAHLYTFLAFEHWQPVTSLFALAGWEVWPRPLIWWKRNGNAARPDFGPRYTYECILFANKGKRPVRALVADVIDCPNDLSKKHAAQKPVEVYENLLQRSAMAGANVLDPFCGSGPIFPAAHRLGMTATGIDSDENSIALAQERINELT